jgi:hypothetical protein
MDKLSHNLREAIIRTIALGDVVDIALTSFEIWQQLGEGMSSVALSEVVAELQILCEKNIIVQHRGRYALRGRGVLLLERARRYRASMSKWHLSRLFLSVLSVLPGVESVGFYNALGYGNARMGSDIDIVLITRERWIWRVRFVAVFLAELFGHRPKPGHIRDGFCLSFFFTPSSDMKSVKRADDPFLAWWLTRLHVVADAHGAYATWQERNQWLAAERPHRGDQTATYFLSDIVRAIVRPVVYALTLPLRIVPDAVIASLSRRLGSKRLWEAAASGDMAVVMRDDMLKLHLTDRRETHAREYARRVDRVMRELQTV